jgi:hypothetical protein
MIKRPGQGVQVFPALARGTMSQRLTAAKVPRKRLAVGPLVVLPHRPLGAAACQTPAAGAKGETA